MTGLDLELVIWARLEAWHEEHATPAADRARELLVERRILWLLAVDGLSQRDAREEVGCSRAAMARHVGVLCEVFPPFEVWLEAHTRRLRAGDLPAAPLPRVGFAGPSRVSRRRLKAPADGAWHKVSDSRSVDHETQTSEDDTRAA